MNGYGSGPFGNFGGFGGFGGGMFAQPYMQYGMSRYGQGPRRPMMQPSMMQPRGDPASVWGKGMPSVQPANDMRIPPGEAPAIGSPPSAFGMDVMPTRPPEYAMPDRAISSPPSAFGFGQQTYGTRPDAFQPPSSGMFAQAAPPQNALVQQANANLFSNPWGFSQQQLGPTFNPAGSPQGGYFQGQTYMPNQGNMRNGLDVLARFGMGWNGLKA